MNRSGTPVLALLVLALGGCNAIRRAPPQIDLTNDPRIHREAEARLALEPTIDAGRIRVAVRGGIVSLYGSVAGMGALQCAISTVQLVDGVRSVVDQMELEPGPREVRCLRPARVAARPAEGAAGDGSPPRQ